jgi:cell division protein ZapA
MPHVSVTINGKSYRMACEEGQQNHLISLAEQFDDYVGKLKGAFGEIGDQRLTVMAAIMVTDELRETDRKLRQIQEELTSARAVGEESLGRARSAETQLAERISQAADRIAQLAERLSGPRRSAE